MRAKQMVVDGMKECLPHGCPFPITVLSARFVGKNTVIAQVELFDVLPGTLEVSRRGGLLSLEWKELAGGAINWNGTCWERIEKLPFEVKE